jgi:uncharacterized membrane protein
MANFAFIFIVMFTAIFMEVVCGALGWLIPFSALAIFHISIVYGWKNGMLAGVFAGAVIDSLYGRSAMTTHFAMIIIAAASVPWLHKGDTSSILPNFLPGAVAGFLVALPPLLFNAGWKKSLFPNMEIVIFATISGSLILPAMIAFLDYISEKSGLPTFLKAKAAVKNRRD